MHVIALGAALASATGFAASTSLQHHAAGNASRQTDGLAAFLRRLLQTPSWLLGQTLAFLSFCLHAVALHFGPLALVQPIVVSGIVIAVPARSALSRRWPGRRELVAVAVATVGVAVFLVATDPSAGRRASPSWASLLFIGGGTAIAGAAVWASVLTAGRWRRPRRAAALLGLSAGVLFGLVAGLIKLCLDVVVAGGSAALLTSWPLYLLLLCGAGGVVSNQRAYTLAGLSASLPVLNIVNVVVALLFGMAVFAEIPAHGVVALLLQIGALGTVMLGLLLVAQVEEASPDAVREAAPLSAR